MDDNEKYQKYLDYINQFPTGQLSIFMFDEYFTPIGMLIRDHMIRLKMIYIMENKIFLNKKGL